MSIRVPYETVKSTVTQAFLNLGLSQEKAEKCAEIHTESSLEGIESHGLNRVPRFAEYVQKGWVDINAEPELVGAKGAHGVPIRRSLLWKNAKRGRRTGCFRSTASTHIMHSTRPQSIWNGI